MSVIKVKSPGQTVPRVEKRAIESITYTIDLSELLLPTELANEIVEITGKLELTDTKIKHGRNIEVRIPSSVVSTSQYLDYTVNVLFSTNTGNTRAAVFQVRVHK